MDGGQFLKKSRGLKKFGSQSIPSSHAFPSIKILCAQIRDLVNRGHTKNATKFKPRSKLGHTQMHEKNLIRLDPPLSILKLHPQGGRSKPSRPCSNMAERVRNTELSRSKSGTNGTIDLKHRLGWFCWCDGRTAPIMIRATA